MIKSTICAVLFKIVTRIKYYRGQVELTDWRNTAQALAWKNREVELANICRSRIEFKELELTFEEGRFKFFMEGYHLALRLKAVADCKFQVRDDILIVKIGECNFAIETLEELYIINEIFVEDVYEFKISSAIVLDIGGNVGISAVYFASLVNVRKVIVYEPVPQSVSRFNVNLSLNPKWSDKILMNNFGLGGYDQMVEVYYDPLQSGKTSMFFKSRWLSVHAKKIKISIRDCVPEFSRVADVYSGYNIIAKVDCEGAEYEIVQRLVEGGMSNIVSLYIIEYHNDGHEELVKELRDFRVSVHSGDQANGLLYARRKLIR